MKLVKNKKSYTLKGIQERDFEQLEKHRRQNVLVIPRNDMSELENFLISKIDENFSDKEANAFKSVWEQYLDSYFRESLTDAQLVDEHITISELKKIAISDYVRVSQKTKDFLTK